MSNGNHMQTATNTHSHKFSYVPFENYMKAKPFIVVHLLLIVFPLFTFHSLPCDVRRMNSKIEAQAQTNCVNILVKLIVKQLFPAALHLPPYAYGYVPFDSFSLSLLRCVVRLTDSSLATGLVCTIRFRSCIVSHFHCLDLPTTLIIIIVGSKSNQIIIIV